MTHNQAREQIKETFGRVPMMFQEIPDYLLPTEWQSFERLGLSDRPAIPAKYRELIGLAVSGATRCRYCVHFHTEAARLFGATEEEIRDAALVAKNTMGWSTYLNTRNYDYNELKNDFDRCLQHVRQQMMAPA